ncbi:hypothetical protein N7E81_16470 [Reichenbachiella carrageenanivorans]|uniref:Uncharacterized protein n=1 Tax=Reichenbachiella carrageenanivorans TaxID=2979869 RepID=A0ABY6D524_9BACT|nr:hypothetical protein [Reichenbachiella carrageenanivorans]UXX78950.1 hypothetical protein N7E81_16470 [Reichenbachiella carrageenanivorans]
MKKTVLSLALVFYALFAFAQSNINTKDYKFDMSIPQGFGFKLLETEGYAKIEGFNGETKTKINAYAFTGEQYTRANIVNFAVNETGIPEKNWEKVVDGEDENGFAWWDTYEAQAGEEMIYAVVAKNKFNPVHYLFFAQAKPESFEENQEQYIEWAMSCQGIE